MRSSSRGALVPQKARHLAHKERIALRPLVHGFGDSQARLGNAKATQQLLHLGSRKSAELHTPELRRTPQLSQCG